MLEIKKRYFPTKKKSGRGNPLQHMLKNANICSKMPTYAKQSLEEIFNNFYYKILYSYPFIGDYYINTML